MNRTNPKPLLISGLLAGAVSVGIGCNSAGSGAATGAGLGALSGLALGSLSGNAGSGAAAGAVIGGLTGAVIGDQNRRRDELARERQRTRDHYAERYRDPSLSPAERERLRMHEAADIDRVSLVQFDGRWAMEGWVETEDGTTIQVEGAARGYVGQRYFVDVDVDGLADPRSGEAITGRFQLASEPGLGLTMTTRFSTAPNKGRYLGDVDESGTRFTLQPLQLADGPRAATEIELRFFDDDSWTAAVRRWSKGRQRVTERYTFTRQ
ncbi:MAG: glycine zipper domain-containing protein [Planctomycetota bacterium]